MKALKAFSLALVLVVGSVVASLMTISTPSQASVPQILEFQTMVGVPRPYTGSANAIRGVSGGGLPWVITSGRGELSSTGHLEVTVRGLVIDPNDPAAITAGVAGKNPSPVFKAIVSCLSKDAAGSPTTVNVSTGAFPATTDGNAKIEADVSLPSPCIAPIVFVTSNGGAWFAATGN